MKRAFLIALALLFAACDAGLDPYTDDGSPFALDGTLSLQADTQTVRVQLLRQRRQDQPLGAFTFRSGGPEGEVVWENVAAEDAAGEPIYLARAPLALQPGATYTLTATDERGQASWVAFEMLAQAGLQPGPPFVSEDTLRVNQTLTLNAFHLEAPTVTVVYELRPTTSDASFQYERVYKTQPRGAAQTWNVNLLGDLRSARRAAGLPFDATVVLKGTRVAYRQEQAVGVQNGFGTIVLEGDFESEWALPDSLLGYLDLTRS